MKRFFYYVIAILILVGLYYVEQEQNTSISQENYKASQNRSELSTARFLPTSNQEIIHHKTYSLSYNERHEQAEWTAHVLRESDIKKVNFKRPYFEIDELVSTGAANWRNYKNSGYDRGHLVPAGDRRGSLKDYEETFLTSNISPQIHEFNAGIWNDLEQQIRAQVEKRGDLYIITGPILDDNLPAIGNEDVSVPAAFFKIIYNDASNHGEPNLTAFLIPHKNSNQPTTDFIVAVDQIEELTGIDFFSQLPDDVENRLEQNRSTAGW